VGDGGRGGGARSLLQHARWSRCRRFGRREAQLAHATGRYLRISKGIPARPLHPNPLPHAPTAAADGLRYHLAAAVVTGTGIIHVVSRFVFFIYRLRLRGTRLSRVARFEAARCAPRLFVVSLLRVPCHLSSGWTKVSRHALQSTELPPTSYSTSGFIQPFSQKSRTATVPKVFQIGLCGVVEADLELSWDSWSVGFLGERLYSDSLDNPTLQLLKKKIRVSNRPVQPFSQKSRTATVPKVFQIGLCGVVEADIELFWDSWSVGFLGERLYDPAEADLEHYWTRWSAGFLRERLHERSVQPRNSTVLAPLVQTHMCVAHCQR